jgi:hypothetical protein
MMYVVFIHVRIYFDGLFIENSVEKQGAVGN